MKVIDIIHSSIPLIKITVDPKEAPTANLSDLPLHSREGEEVLYRGLAGNGVSSKKISAGSVMNNLLSTHCIDNKRAFFNVVKRINPNIETEIIDAITGCDSNICLSDLKVIISVIPVMGKDFARVINHLDYESTQSVTNDLVRIVGSKLASATNIDGADILLDSLDSVFKVRYAVQNRKTFH